MPELQIAYIKHGLPNTAEANPAESAKGGKYHDIQGEFFAQVETDAVASAIPPVDGRTFILSR
jgi:hypothetical protein